MTRPPDIIACLERDEGVMALLGSPLKILRGTPAYNLSYAPPLLFIDIKRGTCAIEGEAGILADQWRCEVLVLTEGSPDELLEAVNHAMESIGFACASEQNEKCGRPEWSSIKATYQGARIRI